MHDGAKTFLSKYQNASQGCGLDIGGRYINGCAREYWPNIEWTVIDIQPESRLTTTPYCHNYIIEDAKYWTPDKEYDLVLCTEVLEHVDHWAALITTAYKALRPTGELYLTCATNYRVPHSAIDGAQLRLGEYYENVRPETLKWALKDDGFDIRNFFVNEVAGDIYVYATK